MELIAAIDLLGGRAKRLVQGDYDRPIEQSADPLELAATFIGAGISRLHVVDLDGARVGRPVNDRLAARIAQLAHEGEPPARVQTGGGLREEQSVEWLLTAGADEVILGSAALLEPDFLARCARRWPSRVGAALDLRDGRLAVSGWRSEIDSEPTELAARLLDGGASRLQVTDIARDGTGAGPNLELLAHFRSRFPAAVLVAAGGVATAAHLQALAALGLDGAIVGRALLDGSLEISEALTASTAGVSA